MMTGLILNVIHKMFTIFLQITDTELFNLEVEESKLRDKTEDLDLFKKNVGGIRESLNTIRELKRKKDATGVGIFNISRLV